MKAKKSKILSLKICSGCKLPMSRINFYKNRTQKDGLNNVCKTCNDKYYEIRKSKNPERMREINRQSTTKWRKAHPERVKEQYIRWAQENPESILESSYKYRKNHPERVRNSRIKYRYGISLAKYDALLCSQNNLCALCERPPSSTRLSIDHDHKTGEVRGLIHKNCNALLGMANDNSNILRLGIEYLKRTQGR